MLLLDHIAVAATDLAQGVDWVERQLGVTMAPGGQHPVMGTHNRLLGLGPLYLEVIAIDPDAPAPARPRWFDLDRFTGQPRLSNWIARCDDLEAALSVAPDGAGVPVALSRGDLRWQMAVPGDGRLPFDGAYPALIAWKGAAHPAARLPDCGCRLTRLEVIHPDAQALRAALAGQLQAPEVEISQGAAPALRAHIDGPKGPVVLS